MTTLDAPVITSSSRLYRTAGIAALVAGITYVVQPLIVFALVPPTPEGTPVEETFPEPDRIPESRWLSTLAGVEFFVVGLATIILVVAIGALVNARRRTVWSTVGQSVGIVGGASWIFMGAMSFAGISTVAQALVEVGADIGAQRAALQAVNIVLTGFIVGVALAMPVWLASLATAGRRSGVIGTPLAAASAITAALIAITLVVLNVAFGILLLIPYFVGLGVALLVKSRATTVEIEDERPGSQPAS